jgi:hypothetical protein
MPKVISGDKAKTQTYCEIQELGEQMERAYEKRNLKLVDELLQQSVASPNDGRANRLRVCRGNRRVTGARREIGENRAGHGVKPMLSLQADFIALPSRYPGSATHHKLKKTGEDGRQG